MSFYDTRLLEMRGSCAKRVVGMVGYFAPILIVKHVKKYISPGPTATITFTTGSVSERPIPGWSAVAGYASALHALTRILALDLKPVRVNLISPGVVDANLCAHMSEDEKDTFFDKIGKRLPLGKVAAAEDVAEAYCM